MDTAPFSRTVTSRVGVLVSFAKAYSLPGHWFSSSIKAARHMRRHRPRISSGVRHESACLVSSQSMVSRLSLRRLLATMKRSSSSSSGDHVCILRGGFRDLVSAVFSIGRWLVRSCTPPVALVFCTIAATSRLFSASNGKVFRIGANTAET